MSYQLQRVQIVNRNHPHFEEYGRFTGKIIRMRFGDRKEMAEVKLEHCRHGCDACFVAKSDARQVGEQQAVASGRARPVARKVSPRAPRRRTS